TARSKASRALVRCPSLISAMPCSSWASASAIRRAVGSCASRLTTRGCVCGAVAGLCAQAALHMAQAAKTPPAFFKRMQSPPPESEYYRGIIPRSYGRRLFKNQDIRPGGEIARRRGEDGAPADSDMAAVTQRAADVVLRHEIHGRLGGCGRGR